MSKKNRLLGLILLIIIAVPTIWYLFQASDADDDPAVETVEPDEDDETNEETLKNQATFTDVVGDVELIRDGEIISITNDLKLVIQENDQLKTGDGASVSMYFHEQTSVHLGGQTSIIIYEWEEQEDHHVIRMEQLTGQIWNDVKTGDDYHVTRDDHVIAVKGTHFIQGTLI